MKLKILKTIVQLKEYCRMHEIKGFSSLRKKELTELVIKYIDSKRKYRKQFKSIFRKDSICRNCKIAYRTCYRILGNLDTNIKEICPIYRYKIKGLVK